MNILHLQHIRKNFYILQQHHCILIYIFQEEE